MPIPKAPPPPPPGHVAHVAPPASHSPSGDNQLGPVQQEISPSDSRNRRNNGLTLKAQLLNRLKEPNMGLSSPKSARTRAPQTQADPDGGTTTMHNLPPQTTAANVGAGHEPHGTQPSTNGVDTETNKIIAAQQAMVYQQGLISNSQNAAAISQQVIKSQETLVMSAVSAAADGVKEFAEIVKKGSAIASGAI